MNGTFSAEYWRACETELKTLEEDMNVWTLVKRTPDMNVLPGTWAFKCKRFPDGTPKKHKARFCVRDDRQIRGVVEQLGDIFTKGLGREMFEGLRTELMG